MVPLQLPRARWRLSPRNATWLTTPNIGHVRVSRQVVVSHRYAPLDPQAARALPSGEKAIDSQPDMPLRAMTLSVATPPVRSQTCSPPVAPPATSVLASGENASACALPAF